MQSGWYEAGATFTKFTAMWTFGKGDELELAFGTCIACGREATVTSS